MGIELLVWLQHLRTLIMAAEGELIANIDSTIKLLAHRKKNSDCDVVFWHLAKQRAKIEICILQIQIKKKTDHKRNNGVIVGVCVCFWSSRVLYLRDVCRALSAKERRYVLHFGLIMTDKWEQTDKRMAEWWKGLPDKQTGAAIDR